MKRYFSKKDFVVFINLLEENKPTKVFTESVEDNSVDEYTFVRTKIEGLPEVVLFENSQGYVSVIQDTPIAPFEDYSKIVFDGMVYNGEYKVFIEHEDSRDK